MRSADLKALVNHWANRINVTTSNLPIDVANVEKVRAALHGAIEQRDDLLAACRALSDAHSTDAIEEARRWAIEAIAKAERDLGQSGK